MPELESTEDRLERLQRRWEQDRTSRIFVQLAEEYRRRGEHASALAVLEEGLKSHPNYLSAQVALGRVQLELGQVDAAREMFERVTSQDPTHLLAIKLLAQSRLRQKDRAGALEALERYRLLGAPTEELEEVERWLAEAAGAGDAGGPALEATVGSREGEPVPGQETGSAGRRGAAPALEPGVESFPGAGPARLQAEGHPSVGQVFRLQPVSPPPMRLTRRQAPSPRRFVALRGGAELRVPPPAPLRLVAEEVFPLWARARPPSHEPRAGEPPILEAAAQVAVEPPAAPAPAASPEAAIPEEAATATLGEIYLRQGHVGEAERIFRRVLDHDPQNPAALAGLEAVARRRQGPVEAQELLGADGREVRGITARKILVLNRYLERLRGEPARDRE